MTDTSRFTFRLRLNDIPLYIWGAFILSFPIYIFKSGGVQPSSLVLGFCLFSLLLRKHPPDLSRFTLPITLLFLFATWIALVNYYFFNQYGDTKFLLSASYYLYNFILFVIGLSLFQLYGPRFFIFSAWAAAFSQIPCIVLSPFAPARTHGGTTGYDRTVFFFQDPNQYGYFCVLIGTMALYTLRVGLMRRSWASLIVTINTLLCFLSVSRASIAAMAVLCFFTFSWRTMFIAGAVASIVGVYFIQDIVVLDRLEHRVELLGQQDQSDVRQVSRLMDNPDYLVLGAGEGAIYERFNAHHEIHSMMPNIAFSYGMVGIILFACFLMSLIARLNFVGLLYLMPIFMYNTVHNGIRFSLGWVALTIAFTAAFAKEDSRRSWPAAPRPAIPGDGMRDTVTA